MDLTGPDTYDITFSADGYAVRVPGGAAKFCGAACRAGEKLYVVSVAGRPVYVGITSQTMSSRFRTGWHAKGETGYYGYRWRREPGQGTLRVWYSSAARIELETIEAELVFLIRRNDDQWPAGQTEIHFHASTPEHRSHAEQLFEIVRAAP